MTTQQVSIDSEALKKAVRRGVIAAVALAILTVFDFYVAISLENPLYPLLPFIAVKGWIILDTFMHVRAVFGEDH
ncbi:MAG: hypothetical protein BMS9Abin20_1329 [Acidimicrobiia bacterium]|nr:MAG: hypothetical protein BMS9Abin20_1329 [Acidimicrobiia bacterium]